MVLYYNIIKRMLQYRRGLGDASLAKGSTKYEMLGSITGAWVLIVFV